MIRLILTLNICKNIKVNRSTFCTENKVRLEKKGNLWNITFRVLHVTTFNQFFVRSLSMEIKAPSIIHPSSLK